MSVVLSLNSLLEKQAIKPLPAAIGEKAMALRWRGWRLKFAVAGFIPALLWADCAVAQRRPVADETMGNERSLVTPETIRGRQGDLITGGAQRGANLFHSFQEFSIGEGRAAYFDNPAGVENILGRVTGGGRSEILGRLGVLGNANLFLINPNGIVFGTNASLDIRGSFVSTSANSVQFGNQGFFSASEPNAPPLLTVDPSALLFNRLSSGAIENSSRARQPNASGVTQTVGLRAANGQSLLLVGGDVLMNRGLITASGGRVELGGLAGEGSIALVENDGLLRLQFPENVRRSNVSADRAEITANQGDIAINARNLSLNITDLTTRPNSGSAAFGDRPGNIEINVSESATFSGSDLSSSTFSNQVSGGNINITARNLILTNSSSLSSNTFSRRSGGNIEITAETLFFRNGAEIQTDTRGQGNSGNLTITAGTLSITNGSELSNSTFARGNAGTININASELVEVVGIGGVSDPSAINADAQVRSEGQGGNLRIQTRRLVARDGGQIGSGGFGRGNVGNVTIFATDSVEVSGRSPAAATGTIVDNADDGSLPSLISTQVERQGRGNGGNIRIETENLRISRGAAVSARSFGEGRSNGGSILIIAPGLIDIDGIYEYEKNNSPQIRRSGLFTQVGRRVAGDRIEGNAGNIRIETGRLLIRNGGNLNSRNSGLGRAGNIRVTASSIEMSGRSSRFGIGSVFTAESIGTGNAGNLTITADEVILNDQSKLAAETESGSGGNIQLQISSLLRLSDRSVISASTQGGRGGNLTLNANRNAADNTTGTVQINNSQLLVRANGSGIAGSINLNARQLLLQNRSVISATTVSGQRGGNISLGLERLQVNNSTVSASTQTGRAGRLSINATDSIALDRGSLAVRAQSNGAIAGNLQVSTHRLVAENSSATVSSPEGQAGNLTIAANSVLLDRSRLTAETQGRGGESGATIRLQSLDSLVLQNRSLISAQARGNSRGGNVVINSDFIVAPLGQNSDIVASAAQGQGGEIQITTQGLFGLEEQPIGNSTNDIDASSQFGVQGTVTINRPDVDPSRGLAELPIAPVDASNQIAQTCPTGGSRVDTSALDEFVITGRGGLPTNPIAPLNSDDSLADWAALESEQPNRAIVDVPDPSTASLSEYSSGNSSGNPSENSMIEATAWKVNPAGKVVLTAQAHALPQMIGSTPINCQ